MIFSLDLFRRRFIKDSTNKKNFLLRVFHCFFESVQLVKRISFSLSLSIFVTSWHRSINDGPMMLMLSSIFINDGQSTICICPKIIHLFTRHRTVRPFIGRIFYNDLIEGANTLSNAIELLRQRRKMSSSDL